MGIKSKLSSPIIRKLNSYNKLRTAGWPSYKILLFDIIGKINKNIRSAALRKLGFEIARKEYGLKFTSDSNIQEVIFDRIYTVYPEFVPSKNDIIVDVGAQHGDYAILCSKYYGAKVYSFEPLPSNFNILKRNINLNKINHATLKCYKMALGDKNHKTNLFYEGDQVMNLQKPDSIKVDIKTLDSFNFKPDIIKIDVEGFEMSVLKGAKKTIQKYHPKIIIETHTKKLKLEVIKFLIELNYSLKYQGRAIYNLNKDMDLIQNLFFIKDSKNHPDIKRSK